MRINIDYIRCILACIGMSAGVVTMCKSLATGIQLAQLGLLLFGLGLWVYPKRSTIGHSSL